MKVLRLACQNLCSCGVVGWSSNENVTRASMYCKHSSGLYFLSRTSKCLLCSVIEAEKFMNVKFETVFNGNVG